VLGEIAQGTVWPVKCICPCAISPSTNQWSSRCQWFIPRN